MTWLSSDAGLSRADAGPERGAFSMSWTWQDLGPDLRPGGRTTPTPAMVEAEREREREEAYERGFNDGAEAGRAQALQEMGPNLQASVRVVAEVDDFREALLAQMQNNLTALALAVARQLIEREVRAEPEVVANLVRNALSHFPLDQKLRIRLNPVDLSNISREQSESRTPVTAGREVRWIPDEGIARGGCVVEGPERIVDGRIDLALERIYRTVSNG
jgi:flagellar biosynthesis/type III secretory pathway protein FliH